MSDERTTILDRLRAYFEAREGLWLDGMEIAKVAGCYAWRTRISELRRRGMRIENRQRRPGRKDGRVIGRVVSEYRYVSAVATTEADEWRAVFAGAERREGTA